MSEALILQVTDSLLEERTKFLIKDRRPFMHFLGLKPSNPVPHMISVPTFGDVLALAQIECQPSFQVLFWAYEAALRRAGFRSMGGQIIDATVLAGPKQRNTKAINEDEKAGSAPDAWKKRPAKFAQNDRHARWTIRWLKVAPSEDGSKPGDIPVPAFGRKDRFGIDHRHGLNRTRVAMDVARYSMAPLPSLLLKAGIAGPIWADTTYHSKQNEVRL